MLFDDSQLNFVSLIGAIVLVSAAICAVLVCASLVIHAWSEKKKTHAAIFQRDAVKNFCAELRQMSNWMHDSPEVKSYIRIVTDKVFTNVSLDPDVIRDEWYKVNTPELDMTKLNTGGTVIQPSKDFNAKDVINGNQPQS